MLFRSETVEGDLAGLGVDLDDLDFDGIAEIEDVFDLADASIGHAADMKQAVLVRRQLHECAERLDAHDCAFIGGLMACNRLLIQPVVPAMFIAVF